MSESTRKSVADSLEAEERLLPWMDYLLQDLWALGSATAQILDCVELLELDREKSTALDLGCGKGAVLVQLAVRYGLRVTGIDATESFLEAARHKAEEHGVSSRCEFRPGDIREYTADRHEFDLVILASLGGVLGSFKDTVKAMRRQVRSDGYILIDDGYLKEKKRLERKGYQHYCNHADTLAELTHWGDRLVHEISTSEMSREINDQYLEVIRRRSNELIREKPELEPELSAYLRLQEEECEVLERDLEGAMWVLQKQGE